MQAIRQPKVREAIPTSCGTLIVNTRREILLCHVTGTQYWDIPKGLREYWEQPLMAAQRELMEETGLQLHEGSFRELGEFEYLENKRLHLFHVHVPGEMIRLEQLVCTSYFSHAATGKKLPEMDDYRWARKEEIPDLCTRRMARRLLSLAW